MPYTNTDELPSKVKDHLPPAALSQFMNVVNSVLESGGSEEKAFTEAWGVIGKKYEKNKDGMWKAMKNTEHVFYFTNSGAITLSKHDAILQTLDRWIGGYFMNASAFNPDAWDGIPIIYQQNGIHPDLLKFATNPVEELKRINGKLVGVNRSPAIDVNGHARLTSNLTIEDSMVDGLINSKKISLSTGFFGKSDEANKLTATTPNHILLFEEGSGGSAAPVDIGAIILNSKDLKPYGDVAYADPGYQEDKVHRYPIDTEEHVRAAWSYINMPKNADKYSPEQLASIKSKIESAAKKFDIQIIHSEAQVTMADTKLTKEEMDKMLDFMKTNPGSMDKETMDKMWSAIDKANQKEYMKSKLKDLNDHPEMMDDEMKGMMSEMKVIKNSIMKEIEDKMAEENKQTEVEKQVQILNSQLEAKGKETAALEARIKAFELEKEVQIKNTRADQWAQIKNSMLPGLTHEAEAEKKLQEQFMGDPFAFSVFLAKQIKPVTTERQGVEHTIVNSDPDTTVPRVGNWNPTTKKWEV